jgi:hypothetical protein
VLRHADLFLQGCAVNLLNGSCTCCLSLLVDGCGGCCGALVNEATLCCSCPACCMINFSLDVCISHQFGWMSLSLIAKEGGRMD